MNSIAIAHKDYQVRGGGERFAEILASELECPLFIGGSQENVELAYDDTRPITTARIQDWCINRGGVLRSLAYLAAWESESRLTNYDTIITSGNEPLWYVGPPEQTHIAYCHSPPRVLYDLTHNTGRGTLGAILRRLQRTLFQSTVAQPDKWIANSEIVKRRLTKYFHLDASEVRVVYPPVQVDQFSPGAKPTEGYYMYLGRLAHHKGLKRLFEAFGDRLGDQLIVAGRNPESVRDEAPENVDFLGYVTEQEKRDRLSEAQALVFPAEREDFGIVPIEGLASGTPVLAYREGFTQYQIRDGVNGILIDTGQPFTDALDVFEAEGVAMSPEDMAAWARQFGVERFTSEMNAIISNTGHRITPGIEWGDYDS